MYKVFLNGGTVFLRDDFKATFRNNNGLFYRYQSREELAELIESYSIYNKIPALFLFHQDLDFLWKEFVSCFKLIHAAGGLVFNSKGKFLVIKRNDIWDLPKGKTEKGETAGEAAIREVSEECGLDSLVLKKSLIKTYHTYYLGETPILKETEWFLMKTNGSEITTPQIKEAITEVKWLKESEVPMIINNTYPSIVDVLRKAKIL